MKKLNRVLGLSFVILLIPHLCWAQGGGGSEVDPGLRHEESKIWNIFGHVTDVRGEPLHDVRIRLSATNRAGGDQLVSTNLKGEFQAQFSLEADMYKKITVRVVADKEGYGQARETAVFGAGDKFSGIDLVMRKAGQGRDSVPIEPFVDALGPGLRESASKRLTAGAEDWAAGCDDLLKNHNAAAAIPHLLKAVDRAPNCIECRTLLSMAMLQGGSWAGGTRQLEEALKLNETAKEKRPEPLLLAGAYRGWRGEPAKSGAYYQKALEIAPGHPLALQETGRLLFEQGNYGGADQLLEKALAAGASPEARLMRIRALMELGDVQEAAREMDVYSAGREPKNLPFEGREVYIQVRDRLEVAPFSKVKSVIDQSPQDLVNGIPELKGLRPAANQDDLNTILKKAGESVERFVKNFPNTISTEKVHQERLDKGGKVKNSLDQEFQYLLLPRKGDWGLGLEESRTTAQGQITTIQGYAEGFVLTNGFSACSWVFHPSNQPATKFRYLGNQTVNEKEMLVVAFAQKPETTRLKARFTTEEGSSAILFQGVVWMDPSSYQIVRLRNELLSPIPKLRLQRQTTEIQYQQVHFKEVAAAFWVPQEIDVTIDLRGRIYRNMHSYSDFRLFNVEAKEGLRSGSTPPTGQPRAN
jgi:tetratricopeptide (TPR) repeat protein